MSVPPSLRRGRRLQTVRLRPGEHRVAAPGERLVAAVGFGIGACVRDRARGLGGMTAFVLPVSPEGTEWEAAMASGAMRHGNYAMELLVTALAKRGGGRERFEVMLFGAAEIRGHRTLAAEHRQFARAYAAIEGMAVVREALGESGPCEAVYRPDDGEVELRGLSGPAAEAVIGRELRYLATLRHREPAAVELF